MNDDEIRAIVRAYFPASYVSFEEEHYDITLDEDSTVRLRFQDLNKLSGLLGTDKIDLMRGEHHEGLYYSSWTNQDSYTDPQFLRVYRG